MHTFCRKALGDFIFNDYLHVHVYKFVLLYSQIVKSCFKIHAIENLLFLFIFYFYIERDFQFWMQKIISYTRCEMLVGILIGQFNIGDLPAMHIPDRTSRTNKMADFILLEFFPKITNCQTYYSLAKSRLVQYHMSLSHTHTHTRARGRLPLVHHVHNPQCLLSGIRL